MKNNVVAILHNIRSIHNVGSMFRTADGAGVAKLYLTGITPSPVDRLGKYDPRLAKVSLGAEKTAPWQAVRSPRAVVNLIKDLKKQGYLICAVEQHKRSIPYNYFNKLRPQLIEVKRKSTLKVKRSKLKPVALIFGNEVTGVPPSILKSADKILEIPMRGAKESLNVSVAFGIVAYTFLP